VDYFCRQGQSAVGLLVHKARAGEVVCEADGSGSEGEPEEEEVEGGVLSPKEGGEPQEGEACKLCGGGEPMSSRRGV